MRAGDVARVQAEAIAQAQAGAHALDVNAGVPSADERALLVAVVQAVMQVTDLPLCLDSANPLALEGALQVYPGKALINSVTGEDRSLEHILPLAKKYNAAVIGLAYDESGISFAPERRVG